MWSQKMSEFGQVDGSMLALVPIMVTGEERLLWEKENGQQLTPEELIRVVPTLWLSEVTGLKRRAEDGGK